MTTTSKDFEIERLERENGRLSSVVRELRDRLRRAERATKQGLTKAHLQALADELEGRPDREASSFLRSVATGCRQLSVRAIRRTA